MNQGAPILYGASYSVYVRAVLMTLAAKGVGFQHEPVDIFAEGGAPASYRGIHPFGKIPAFRHGDFVLYETIAITRYIDEGFNGPPLQPAGAGMRARMTQLMCMADNYGYRPMVWDIYVERSSRDQPDEERIVAAIAKARLFLTALNQLTSGSPWLLGSQQTLADFHLAPMFGYFLQTAEGEELIKEFPRLGAWWDHIRSSEGWRAASASS